MANPLLEGKKQHSITSEWTIVCSITECMEHLIFTNQNKRFDHGYENIDYNRICFYLC
jgi:hypothetical protein